MKPKFKQPPTDYYQSQLMPANIFDLLPEDHDCFIYQPILQLIDTTEVDKLFSTQGQHAYSPQLIISILIYAYTHGVFSSRQIEKRSCEDIGFMYIAGLHCPNFRVLSDFRKLHHEFFMDCFKQTVKMALELKLVTLGHVSLDGSKFKANSSKYKAMSYGRLKEQEQQLCSEIEELVAQADRCDEEENRDYKERTGYELPDDLTHKETRLEKISAAKEALEEREKKLHPNEKIEDKKQISFADTDAGIMGKNGHFEYAYNPQISVDADNQIIVGQHISQRANDQQEVEEALIQIEDTCGNLPGKLSMDNGYYSGSNLAATAKSAVEFYIATDRQEKLAKDSIEASTRILVKADFSYDEEQDGFHCPQGELLPLKSKRKDGKRLYQLDRGVCEKCPLFSRCSQSKKGEARTISTDQYEPLRRDMNKHMSKKESKDVYDKRKTIVEPAFGHIKNGGFKGFSVRGITKVKGEFSLVCAAHNIKKIVKACITGLVRPDVGKWSKTAT